MKVAYFSTATAIGSCSSYSRFTISGGLLMIDMIPPSFFLSSWPYRTRGKHMVNRAFSCSLGWSDRHGSRGNEVGSLQPIPGFCPRPNGSSRHAQPLCSQQLRGTPGVTRKVTGRVTCVFHAPVTAAKDLCHWGTVFLHQESPEKYGPVGLALRKLQP